MGLKEEPYVLARMQGLILISCTIDHRTKDSPICGIGWHKRPKDTILIKYRDNKNALSPGICRINGVACQICMEQLKYIDMMCAKVYPKRKPNNQLACM